MGQGGKGGEGSWVRGGKGSEGSWVRGGRGVRVRGSGGEGGEGLGIKLYNWEI